MTFKIVEELQSPTSVEIILINELLRRGVQVEIVDYAYNIYRARYDDHTELLQKLNSSVNAYSPTLAFEDRFTTSNLLRKIAVKTPGSMRYWCTDQKKSNADSFLDDSKQCVLKPHCKTESPLLTMQIRTPGEIETYASIIEEHRIKGFVLEEEVAGQVLDLFITNTRKYLAFKLSPPTLMGNGKDTILKLLQNENRHRDFLENTYLQLIPLDQNTVRCLNVQSFDLKSVPANGEIFSARSEAAIKTGAIAEDVTDSIHPDLVDLCHRVCTTISGLSFLRLRIIARSLAKAHTLDNYNIISLDTLPNLYLDYALNNVRKHTITSLVVDAIFPETAIV